MNKLIAMVIGAVGVTTFYAISIGMFAGWPFWIWIAIKLGSFGMFFFGLLGPFSQWWPESSASSPFFFERRYGCSI